MYEIRVQSGFSSAHRLREYKGRCEELHGHNWKVEVFAQASELNKLGMVVDFTVVKKALRGVLKNLDHRYLNDIAFFKKYNPTSENVARYIFDVLVKKLKGAGLKVSKITVWESDTAAASYSE